MSSVDPSLATRYWRAIATLPVSRRQALNEIESCFRHGTAPTALAGPLKGRLLTTTVGKGVDQLAMGMSRIWMPWKGKTFSIGEGRNLFDNAFKAVLRVGFRGYDDVKTEEDGRISTFPFVTRMAPSELEPELKVLDIDYDHAASPGRLVRDVLDELVEIGEGLYLGQALLRWKGKRRRVAWFQLSH